MLGRAGRPRYDPLGEAWLVCKGGDPRQAADEIADRYIHGPVEDITSKLSISETIKYLDGKYTKIDALVNIKLTHLFVIPVSRE